VSLRPPGRVAGPLDKAARNVLKPGDAGPARACDPRFVDVDEAQAGTRMDKESGSTFTVPWAQGIFLALLFGIGAIFIQDVPFVSDRRTDGASPRDHSTAVQDVDARLWQDPLGVVQRAIEPGKSPAQPARASAPEVASATADEAAPCDTIHLIGCLGAEIRAVRTGKDDALVLAVMVRGGPYSDFVEQRRQARYAVISGLSEMGYGPSDSDHLGWVARPPVEGDVQARHLPDVIPFEWFDMAAERAAKAAYYHETRLMRILVLWLDDRAFTDSPIARMTVLAKALTPDSDADWRIIGPVRSDALQAMAAEKVPEKARESGDPWLHFYAATPTVPDDIIVGEHECRGPHCLSRLLMERQNIQLTRTTADDGRLVRSMIAELQLRGLRPIKLPGTKGDTNQGTYGGLCLRSGEEDRDAPSHIAVVAEWDTLYGRSLRKDFQADYGVEGYCVERFNYMRGLDGLLPGRAEAAPEHEGADAPVPGGKGDDQRKDGKFIERAEGQSQFDYLRRLAKKMRDRDDELRRTSPDGQGLRAVGVLGSDLHDKLLVLQALRPELPNALFFTTDLDARFLHPSEQPWTRNLLIASGFGLRLDDELQGGAPPFRNGYETAQFFATRLLVDDARRALAHDECRGLTASKCEQKGFAGWSQRDLDTWLGVPRIFEIGRTSPFDFTGRDAAIPPSFLRASDAAAHADSRRQDETPCRGVNWLNCADIHPPGSERAPMPNLWGRWLIGLVVSALWLPFYFTGREGIARLRGYLRFEDMCRRRWLLLALFVLAQFFVVPAAIAWAWPPLVDWMTADGKPLVFTEGVSTWPTEIIRVFTLLLGVFLVNRGRQGLAENQEDIEWKFALQVPAQASRTDQEVAGAGLGRWDWLLNIFRWSAVKPDLAPGVYATGADPRVERIWRRHAVQNKTGARLMRAIVFVLLTLLLTLAIVQAFHEGPFVPQRGPLSLHVHATLHAMVYLMLYFVVYFVADAIWLCVSFMRYLWRDGRMWPEATVRHFMAELAIPDEHLVSRWIGLQLAEQRSKEINQLVYYPFVILSLVILSRSSVFDDWQMPMSGKVLMAGAVIVSMVSAWFLRRAAEKTRRAALEDIEKALLRAKALPEDTAPPPTPRQLELMRDQAASLRDGAFAPYSQQPVLKALMIPFATVGGSSLLEYLQLANM
jgi:hypothetical protein